MRDLKTDVAQKRSSRYASLVVDRFAAAYVTVRDTLMSFYQLTLLLSGSLIKPRNLSEEHTPYCTFEPLESAWQQ